MTDRIFAFVVTNWLPKAKAMLSHSKLALLGCILMACPTSLQAQSPGKKYAIVIGVERYDPNFFNPLRYAEDDAIELGRALEDLGFVVVTMTNKAELPAHNPNSADKITKLLESGCARVRPEDTLIVFMAGHGVLFKKQPPLADGSRESYFCPEEADLNKLASLVPMSRVMDIVSRSAADRKLLIVDACRNEAESNLFRASTSTDLGTVGLTPRTVPKGMLALFSCAEKEKSVEHPDLKHGVFTFHVIKYLRGDGEGKIYPRDQVSLIELANYARRETNDYVYKKLNRDQSPVLKSPTEVIDWPLGILQRSLIVNSLDMKLRRIAAGEFMMGNEDSVDQLMQLFPYADKAWFEDAAKQHRVKITKPFYLGQFEVTVGQFRKFVEDTDYKTEAESDGQGGYGLDADGSYKQDPKYTWRNPGFSQANNHPVVNVSWNDAVKFCQWLSRKEGKTYRLPTEAEWEYACRAGTTTRFWFGSNPEALTTVDNVIDGTAQAKYSNWKNTLKSRDGFVTTAPVGSFRENPWGLHDLHGNVGEWCHDWDGDYAVATVSDPLGPSAGSVRVVRGGCWDFGASFCRSAFRSGNKPGYRSHDLGFRLALVPPAK